MSLSNIDQCRLDHKKICKTSWDGREAIIVSTDKKPTPNNLNKLRLGVQFWTQKQIEAGESRNDGRGISISYFVAKL